jgi:hypothetical protein
MKARTELAHCLGLMFPQYQHDQVLWVREPKFPENGSVKAGEQVRGSVKLKTQLPIERQWFRLSTVAYRPAAHRVVTLSLTSTLPFTALE